MRRFQLLPTADAEVVHRFAQVRRDRHRARDRVEQDVPLRAERHQHDAAPVQADAGRDQERGEEREQEVRGEAREDLHDRLRVAGQAGRHADLHADRHPDQRGDDDNTMTRAKVIPPRPNACTNSPSPTLSIDVSERRRRAKRHDDGHDEAEHGVARAGAERCWRRAADRRRRKAASPVEAARRRAATAGRQARNARTAQRVEHDALGCSAASLCSLRNRSDHATSGRQNKKFTPSTMMIITPIASSTWPSSERALASAT